MPITQPTITASLRRRVLIIESRLLIPGIEPAEHSEEPQSRQWTGAFARDRVE